MLYLRALHCIVGGRKKSPAEEKGGLKQRKKSRLPQLLLWSFWSKSKWEHFSPQCLCLHNLSATLFLC